MREGVLVTGAGGFIGQRLLRTLSNSGVPAFGWTRAMGDLRNSDTVLEAIKSIKPDTIVHLAAQPSIVSDDNWKIVADEQKMLSNLAYAMPSHCTLIYTGSMAELGRSGQFTEDDTCTPDTAYGCAKFSTTNLALALRLSMGLDIRVARLFGVFGPGESQTRLLPSLVARLQMGEPVPLSDGLQIRDFVHVDDVCVLLHEFSRIVDREAVMLNFGTGVGVTVRKVCETVADILGADRTLLRFGELPRRHVDQDCLVADTRKLATIFNPPTQRWLSSELATECVAQYQAYLMYADG